MLDRECTLLVKSSYHTTNRASGGIQSPARASAQASDIKHGRCLVNQLTGRTAIVTGGARGIGRAIATRLAREGALVVIGGRERERGEAVVEGLTTNGGRAVFVQTDVTVAEQVAALVDRALGLSGSIEILVNNSGIELPEENDGPSEADWDRMFATNAKGTWLCCRAALPHLLRSRGVIINNASMAGMLGVAGSTGYAASKAAVISLTRSLALAYAETGVRVNAVCPGPIMSDMTVAEWDAVGGAEEGRRRALGVCPARRIGEPEEVAGLVAYLVSDEAAFITGATLAIDGGKTAGLMATERYRW